MNNSLSPPDNPIQRTAGVLSIASTSFYNSSKLVPASYKPRPLTNGTQLLIVNPSKKLILKTSSNSQLPSNVIVKSPQIKRRRKSPEVPDVVTLSDDEKSDPETHTVASDNTYSKTNFEELLKNRKDLSFDMPVYAVYIGTLRIDHLHIVSIAPSMIEFEVLNENKIIKHSIPMKAIKSFEYICQEAMKTVFLSVTPFEGSRIRELLYMKKNNKTFYFDPCSSVKGERYIIFMLQPVSVPRWKGYISLIIELARKKLTNREPMIEAELTEEQVRSRLKDVHAPDQSIQSPSKAVDSSSSRVGNQYTKLLTYPNAHVKGSISITAGDLVCLDEGEFLNDTIIEFYLKYIMDQRLRVNDAAAHYSSSNPISRAYIFNSFFFSSLSQKISNEPSRMVKKRRHENVKNWTKNVNLFEKDFIFVPVNENLHWYLVVICFPANLVRHASNSHVIRTETSAGDAAIINLIRNRTPLLLTFDSLGNAVTKKTNHNLLHGYLEEEYFAKHTQHSRENYKFIPFIQFSPNVPQQTNYYDCGLFVLCYAESFIDQFITGTKENTHFSSWFSEDDVSEMRGHIKQLIQNLSEQQSQS